MIIATDTASPGQTPNAGANRVLGAKLHVLHLEPIKSRLGDKWERLSGLVHKLFERALRQSQGPYDHFLLVDELSYIVTFHDLTVEEATIACTSVAKSVCELLFGADVEDTAVRGLVGMIPFHLVQGATVDGHAIGEMLERHSREIIVTSQSVCPAPRAGQQAAPSPRWQAIDWISKAHERAALTDARLGFSPIWDLSSRKSAALFLSLNAKANNRFRSTRRALGRVSEAYVADTEIALLNAAAEYSHRVCASQKICTVGVGVSYETLSGFNSRIAYITALKAIPTTPASPLLLRVEDVPGGTPTGRLAEIVAMLSLPNLRVAVAFENLHSLPELDIRLGAAVLGASVKSCDSTLVPAMVHRLARRAASQRALVFLQDIDNSEQLSIATRNKVRFGAGRAIDSKCVFTGREPIPDFPLYC